MRSAPNCIPVLNGPPRDLDAGSGEALNIRFQADNDLKRIIVDAPASQPRIDFQAAQAARLNNPDDEAVLRQAASQSGVLVSHDKPTMQAALAGERGRTAKFPAASRTALKTLGAYSNGMSTSAKLPDVAAFTATTTRST